MPKSNFLLQGAAWSAIGAAASVATPFAIFILFARWLDPAKVGVAVLAVSLADIMKAFGLPGLYEALLQQGTGTRRHNETACAILLASGSVLFLVYAALLGIIGRFAPGVAEAGPMLALLGLRIAFELATIQPQAALAQHLAFRRMASRAFAASAGAGLFGLGTASAGYPFSGLILYLAAQPALVFAFTVAGTGVMVRPRLHADCLSAMWHEALAASAIRLVAALNNSLDQIVVSAAIGQERLAFFNLGKRVEATFITVAAQFSTILFQPLFARRDTKGGVADGLALLTVVCGAPAAFVVVNAHTLVALVFGDRWQDADDVVALLAASGFARALGSVHGALLSVSRRNRDLMWISGASAASGIAVALLCASSGIDAVAAALAAKNVVMLAGMAMMTSATVARLPSAYASSVMLPWALMLAGGFVAPLLVAPTGLASLAASAAAIAITALFGLRRLVVVPRRGPATDWILETP